MNYYKCYIYKFYFFKKFDFVILTVSKIPLINKHFVTLLKTFKYLVLLALICGFSHINYNLTYNGFYKNFGNNTFDRYEHLIKSIDDSILSLVDEGFYVLKSRKIKKKGFVQLRGNN